MRTLGSKVLSQLAAGALLAAGVVAGAGAQTATTTVNLTAQRSSATMPDGTRVAMWGYCSPDAPSAALGNTALGGATLSGGACASGSVGPWTPGPTITVPAGNALTIHLTNSLPTVTSIVILGQLGGGLGAPVKVLPPPHAAQSATTWQANTSSGITAFVPPTQPPRVESFGTETAAGATGAYTWNALKPGTYLYETGTHPSIQAPMGLYGVLVVTTAPVTAASATNAAVATVTTPGLAYPATASQPAVPYDADAVVLISEIDPVQNNAVDAVAAAAVAGAGSINETVGCFATAPCYPPAVNYSPAYYLLNGLPFDRSNPAANAIGIAQNATAGATLSGNVMLRFVNAGLRTHTPALAGPDMRLIAEDGNRLPGNPKVQSEVLLVAGKTIDAVFSPTQTAGAYDLSAYPVFDRALGLSTGSQRDGGARSYIVVQNAVVPATGQTALQASLSALTGLTGLTGAAQANPDFFTISLNSVKPLAGDVLANDVSVSAATLGTAPGRGTVVLNADGRFTYTPSAPFTASCTPTPPARSCSFIGDTFTYIGTPSNGGAALPPTTVTIYVAPQSTIATTADTYTSVVSSLFRSGGNFGGPGLLANDVDSLGYALSAAPATAGTTNADGSVSFAATGGQVTLYPDGSFIAAPTSAPTSGTATVSFSYIATNSQGIASAATPVTVTFNAGSGLKLNLVDGVSNYPFPPGTGIAGPDYRWVIEEDSTFHTPTNVALAASTPSLATSFHKSHMTMVAQGCTGPISCQITGQSVRGVPYAVPQPIYTTPDQVALDPTKWYFVSVLPGDSANPIVNAFAGDPAQCVNTAPAGANPTAFDPRCGHTMGGASIRPGQLGATVPIQPSPLKPAQLSVFVFEDNAPTNGDPDDGEPGLGGFEVILVDVGGRSAGDPVGQMTYDAFNMPLTNALLGQNGCPDTLNTHTTAASYASPNTAGQNTGNLTGVIYTCPNAMPDGSTAHTITGFSLAAGSAPNTILVTATTADANLLYNGTTVTIACNRGVTCITNAPAGLLGSFVVSTSVNGATGTTNAGSNTFTYVIPGTFNPAQHPAIAPNARVTATDPNQFSLAGQALIKNLMPGRFDVIAHPGAAREGAGETWYQVSTLEGTPGQDAFVKVHEPAYFQEFGPPGPHAFIGFLNPAHIAQANAQLNRPKAYSNSITGRITNLHMSRPVAETMWDSGSRAPLAQTTCLVGLNQVTGVDGTGVNLGFAQCDEQGNFTLTNVPPGDYQIVAWDTWLDQIIAFKAVTVPAGDGQTVAAGDVAVFSWFTRVESKMFLDLDGTHVPSAANPPLAQVPVTIRYRDGSIVSVGLTDSTGNAAFAELFPLFNWYVVESDTTRFKGSAVHTVVDAGGKPDASGTYAGILNSTFPAAPLSYQSLPPCAAGLALVVTAPCKPAGAGPFSTERVDPGATLYEGLQSFVGQTETLDWGKLPYGPTENGGIAGIVVYASTRPFDDPTFLVQNLWEPLVPRVTVNLYQQTTNPDGSTSLTFAATTKTTSWDDWVGAGQPGTQTNLQCPGQLPAAPAGTPIGTFPAGTDPYVTWVLGADQFRCYDGFHQWNQVQPAPYDGAYLFTTFTDVNGVSTGTPLPAGTYVVEVIPPVGYETVKEEDKNILIGDAWVAPLTQQFAGLADIFILPDQASLNANPNNPVNANGVQSNSTYNLGQFNLADRFWPCVGSPHIVPDFLAIFPQTAQVAPFAGASKPLCDRKQVVLANQQQVKANFFIFTPTPIAAHYTGLMLDDAASEINAAAPDFGEKFALGYAPVAIRDFNGVEINRVYTDQWGTFNGLVPSTWQVNPPNPTGYSPNMLITCMNDPGPTAATNALGQFINASGAVVLDPALAAQVKDPNYHASYSNFCYTNPFMPGLTDYLDTPVLPVAAFASGYNPPDCAYPAATPAVASVSGNGSFGPYVDTSLGAPTLTILALGDQPVDNPLYQGPMSTSLAGTIYGQKTILRHFGFGSYVPNRGQCTRTQIAAGDCPTVSQVRLVAANGASYSLTGLNASSWTDARIVARLPEGVPPGTYELVINNATSHRSSVDTVTVTVQDSTAPTAVGVSYVDPGYPVMTPGSCPSGRLFSRIQDAINCAAPGDLILVNTGIYNELVVMWKPVQLQGVGAAAVTIQAAKYPTNKLENWRPVINNLFGIDPLSGNQAAVTQVDPLPGQEVTGGIIQLEPSVLSTEEGAGITVLAKGYRADGVTPLTATDCVAAGASTYLDPSVQAFTPAPLLSNFLCGASRIDGITVTGGDAGGGIYVNGWAHNIEISNNRVYGNAGAFNGGVRVGIPNLEAAGGAPRGGYGYDLNVRVHHNAITRNGTVEAVAAGASAAGGAGAGLTIASGSDNYVAEGNFICGNYGASDGGGMAHIGVSQNGTIRNNTIIFNQTYNQSSTINGGGLIITGESLAGTMTNGTGDVLVDSNLIQGNFAEAGHGGGVRLQQINGTDVVNNPTNTAGLIDSSGLPLPNWYRVTLVNNIIVDNVAGWSGGGVSLADALDVHIANNTIANNDSTGIVGALMTASPVTGQPSPAGISSQTTTNPLGAAAAGSGRTVAYSDPQLVNNIIVNNRSFFFDSSGGVARLCSSNNASDPVAVAGGGACATLTPITTQAQGTCMPTTAGSPALWDLGIVGDASAALLPGQYRLHPDTSILSAATLASYNGAAACGTGNCARNLDDSGLNLVKPICNGPRANPGLQFEPGIQFVPPFQMGAAATVDEGGNFVDLRYGPLSLDDPLAAGAGTATTAGTVATSYSDYRFGLNASTALNSGVDPGVAVPRDIFGTPRPQGAVGINGTAFDIGAYEQPGTGTDFTVEPQALAFGDVVIGTASAMTVTITNSGTTNLFLNFAFSSPRYARATAAQGGGGTCAGGGLAAGTSCTYNIAFAPTVVGTVNATLTVRLGGGATQTVALSGSGVQGGIVVTPTSLAFGSNTVLTASPLQTVTVTNTGTAAVALASAITGPAANTPMYAIGGGSCGLVVQPGQICTVGVTFTPTAVGAYNASLGLSFTVPPSTVVRAAPPLCTGCTVALTGTGVAASTVFTPTALAFGQVQVGTTSAALAVTITNLAAAPLTLNTIALGGANANQFQFPAVAPVGACAAGTVLPALVGTCTVNLSFAPTSVGAKVASVTITPAGVGATPLVVALSGTGMAPAFALVPNPLLMGNQTVGVTSPPQALTVLNTGYGPLTVTSALVNNAVFAATSACPAPGALLPLAAGASCAVNVTVAPAAVGTNYVGTVTVTTSAGTATVPVRATGVGPGAFLAPSNGLSFSSQIGIAAAAQAVSINNTGLGPLPVANVTLAGANAADFTLLAPSCVGFVPAGGNCAINVGFTPRSANETATLQVSYGAGLAAQSVTLTGAGTPPCGATTPGSAPCGGLVPAALSFGPQAAGTTSAAQSVSLTNTGGGPLTIAGVGITGANAADFKQTNSCGTTLSVGSSCTVSVAYQPQAAGSSAATLQVSIVGQAPMSAALSGTATAAPAAALAPASLSLTAQAGIQGPAQVVSLSNASASPLSVGAISIAGTNAKDFGQTSNCPVSLPAGGSCAISVNFTPGVGVAGGTVETATLQVVTGGGTLVATLSGTVSSASVALSAWTAVSAQVGVGIPSTVSLTNLGAGAVKVSSVAVSGTNAADFVATNTCTSNLVAANGGTCTVTVTFTPTTAAAESATLTVVDTAGTQTLALSGTGVAPAASLAPATLAFANTQQGSAATPLTVTLSNGGIGPETISSVTVTGTNAADFTQTNTCTTAAVAAAGTCTVTVTFKPSTAAAETATLTLVDTAGTQTVALTGTGVAPTVTVLPATLAFANAQQGSAAAPLTATLTNTGIGPETVSSVAVSGTNAADFVQTNTCTTVAVAAAGTCTVTVTFTPSTAAAETATLTLVDTAGTQTVALTGTGVAPSVTVLPATQAFANAQQGSAAAPLAVTLTNSGIGPETVSSVTVTGTNAADFTQTNTCTTAAVAAAGTCTVTVTFKPSTAAAETATLTLVDTAGTQTVALTGTGVAPTVTVLPATLAFANAQQGSAAAPLTATLTNTGIGPETVSSVAVSGTNAADFVQTNTCTTVAVAAAGTCTVTVTFTPSTAAAETATLTLVDTAGTQTVALTGTGVAPSVTVLPAALVFANTQKNVAAPLLTLTLTNTGIGPETVSSVAVSGTNATDFVQTNTCTAAVAPAGSCTVTLTFTPSTAAAETATLTLVDTAGTQTVALSGTGVAPTVSILPAALTFAATQQGSAAVPLTVTLTNSGIGPETVGSVAVSGTNAADFVQTNTCTAAAVPAAGTCTVTLTFTPSTAAAESATLTFVDTAGTQTVALAGSGVAPAAAVTPAAIIYGATTAGTSAPAQIVTVSNTGLGPIAIGVPVYTAVAGLATDYLVSSACPASLAAGGTCTVSIVFAPGAGELTGSIDSGTLTISGTVPLLVNVTGSVL